MRRLPPAALVLLACFGGAALGAVLGAVVFGGDPAAAAAQGAQALDAGGGQFAPVGGLLGGALAAAKTLVAGLLGALAGMATGAGGAAVALSRRGPPPDPADDAVLGE